MIRRILVPYNFIFLLLNFSLAVVAADNIAFEVEDFSDLVEKGKIIRLNEGFQSCATHKEKIAKILQEFAVQFTKISLETQIVIEPVELEEARESDAIYAIKKFQDNAYQIIYIVKYPLKTVAEKECLGLFWAKALLGDLPSDSDWAILNFHEAMFWDEGNNQAIIFLNAAKGKPWSQWIKDRTWAKEQDSREQHLALNNALGKTLGLLEAKFLRRGHSTITFSDFHAGNIFFDGDQFSYIDLNSLGWSAKEYFTGMKDASYTKVLEGLRTMIFSLQHPKLSPYGNSGSDEEVKKIIKDCMSALKEGYVSAFSGTMQDKINSIMFFDQSLQVRFYRN